MTFIDRISKWLAPEPLPLSKMTEAEFKAIQEANFARDETDRKHHRARHAARRNRDMVTKALRGEL